MAGRHSAGQRAVRQQEVSEAIEADARLAEVGALGHVPWWPAGQNEVTLHRILVHMTAETHRHAGHADIVRELIDGAVGLRKENDNLAPGDQAWWEDYRDRVERAAQQAAAA